MVCKATLDFFGALIKFFSSRRPRTCTHVQLQKSETPDALKFKSRSGSCTHGLLQVSQNCRWTKVQVKFDIQRNKNFIRYPGGYLIEEKPLTTFFGGSVFSFYPLSLRCKQVTGYSYSSRGDTNLIVPGGSAAAIVGVRGSQHGSNFVRNLIRCAILTIVP